MINAGKHFLSAWISIGIYFLVYCFSFFVSLLIRSELDGFLGSNNFLVSGSTALFWMSAFLYLIVHLLVIISVRRLHVSGRLSKRYVINHSALFLVLLLAAIPLLQLFAVSRLFIAILWITQLLLSLISVWILNKTLFRWKALHFQSDVSLLLGSSEYNEQLVEILKKKDRTLEIKQHDIRDSHSTSSGAFFKALVKLIFAEHPKEIFFNLALDEIKHFERLLIICDSLGIDCYVLNVLVENSGLDSRAKHQAKKAITLKDYICMTTREAGKVSLRTKRILDIALASVLLLLLLPLIVVLGVLIKLDSRGSVFFRQERLGFRGERFKIIKFRSMVENAEELLEKLKLEDENKHIGPAFKMDKDPRVTRIGAFLRRTSLDELPQLFNVLLGEMSLVGPRPPLLKEVLKYQYWHFRRLSVLPGITGLWQVSGRSMIKHFNDWVKLDIEYINNWSFWLDLKIIARTVFIVITGRGAA